MPCRAQPESRLQAAIVAHLKARAVKGLYWFAIPNGGLRSKAEARVMQSTGTRPGVPDLAFVYEGRAYFLEVKTEHGRPTEHQLKAIADINMPAAMPSLAVGWTAACRFLSGGACCGARRYDGAALRHTPLPAPWPLAHGSGDVCRYQPQQIRPTARRWSDARTAPDRRP